MKSRIPIPPLLLASMLAHATPAIHPEYNATLAAQMPLEEGWTHPPRLARTRVWWWWLNGRTDAETITRELEAMKAVGIGGANIIDAGGDTQEGNQRVPHGPDFASPEWRKLFAHAVSEAARLDLELGFNIQSGWNLGGPTVTVEESSKRVTFSSTPVAGGARVEVRLPAPKANLGFYRDVAVVAVPASEPLAGSASASTSQTDHPAAHALDGKPDTFWVSGGAEPGQGPSPQRPQWLELRFDRAVEADRLLVRGRDTYGPKRGSLQVFEGETAREVATFAFKEKGEGVVSFPKVSATRFRLIITDAWDPHHPQSPRNAQVCELTLSAGGTSVGVAAASLPKLEQKAYFAYPGAFTGTEAWHLLDPGPGATATCAAADVLNITDRMEASGRLVWDAPPGRWDVLRFGYTASGAHVSTHSENGGGHAIDYLDRATFDTYWSKVLDPILADVKPWLGKSLRFLHTDSWELGPVNWTRLMPDEFKRLRGYDLTPYLPVLAERVIDSPDASTRFLNDFRRTLADLMAGNKYTAFSERAHAAGLGIHPESGGPHAGPMDALRNLGISDVPMGEFWSPSPRHRVRDDQRFFVKQTTAAANTYGRRVSLAEAFTNIGRHWQHDPRSLKSTFDRAACEGHNLTMWHTFDSSPASAGLPGYAYFAGEHFNPRITWWRQAPAFIAYMNRCHFLLQQGVPAFDVLHFQGENIPAFVRLKRDDPAKCLPGYDYDVIDMEALLTRTSVDADGSIALPEGARYRVLSLVPHDAVSLPALQHIARLVEQGATLVGPRPGRPYSLSGGDESLRAFTALCDRLWGAGDAGEKKTGRGRVIWGRTTREVLQGDGVSADFAWTGGDAETYIDFIHRRTDDTHFYYVANRNPRAESVELAFRMTGLVPEIWDPVTGARREATRYRFEGGRTILPYDFAADESFFVVFRKPAAAAPNGAPNKPAYQPLATLEGPWAVAFDPAWGGPASTTFETLIDWTKHADPGIKFYSGTGVYSKSFTAPGGTGRVFLDLGELQSLCEVSVNGRELGVLWYAPFVVEITDALRAGENKLEVRVVNVWANRVIGDASLPPEKRRTKTNIVKLTADTPLEPSGLLGPVRLLRLR